MTIFLVVAACSTRYGLIYLQIIIIGTNHLNTGPFDIPFSFFQFLASIYIASSAARQSFFMKMIGV